MSVFGIFLVRIQSKCGKIQTRKTPNTDTSRSVWFQLLQLLHDVEWIQDFDEKINSRSDHKYYHHSLNVFEQMIYNFSTVFAVEAFAEISAEV